MNVKILKTSLMIFVILLFSGCSEKILYVDRPVEVYIPTKCIIPEIHCNFNKTTDTEVIFYMRTCIEDLRKSINICQ